MKLAKIVRNVMAAAVVATCPIWTNGHAAADTPSTVWDRARDPNVARRQALHSFAEQSLTLGAPLVSAAVQMSALERARALLEQEDAEHGSDVRLRFDLGEVYEELGHHTRAVEVLTRALKDAPTAEGSTEAIDKLSFAYAHLDRPREERDTYFAFLARETNEASRGTATLNLAEAEMRLGNLTEAVARYHEAFDLSQAASGISGPDETVALATWGLAVSLDRAGDPQGSEEQAALGTQLDRNEQLIANGKNVFFVPEYERFWYIALGMAEEAKAATEPHAAAKLWLRTEQLWTEYVTQAAPTERWLPLVRRHLERTKKLRAQADARAIKAPKPPEGFELYFP